VEHSLLRNPNTTTHFPHPLYINPPFYSEQQLWHRERKRKREEEEKRVYIKWQRQQ
jgi:hypothetical protein